MPKDNWEIKMMRDDFKNVLINQYAEVVEELVVESESVYRSHLDYDLLHQRVEYLIKAARVDGLEESIIWNLLERRVPGFVEAIKSPNKSSHLKLVA